MDGIAKSDLRRPPASPIAAFSYPPDHPAVELWRHPETGLVVRLQDQLRRMGAHPARSVVLLPYAQLLPLANRMWGQMCPDGFAPRFETSRSWSSALGGHLPEASDIHFDVALDGPAAEDLLRRAGLAEHAGALAERLVAAAHQLGALAAAAGPQGRPAWAQTLRAGLLLESAAPALQWEAAVARIALEWAAVAHYATDVLFAPELVQSLDALVLVNGLQPDPIAHGLRGVWGDRLAVVSMASAEAAECVAASYGSVALHRCSDAEDEAQRAVACALAHVQAGRFPLALGSSDRALTRRMRALLDGADVQMRDENGWKLSTSSAAARLMALLKAAAWNASSDAVLNWLKQAPGLAAKVAVLEAALRRKQVRDWRDADFQATPASAESALLEELVAAVNAIRSLLQGRHALVGWLPRLREALDDSGMWEPLQQDAAGVQLLLALRLEGDSFAALQSLAEGALWNAARMDLSEFTAWVNQALEAANFQPLYPPMEEVVFLPMSQMLARPFAALVLAGCDEVRLSPSPEPPGSWTAAQRAVLALPSREDLEQITRAAWNLALQTPVCDVLWRSGDESGEMLLPSPLVELLMQQKRATEAQDPRVGRVVDAQPVLAPQPRGMALPVTTLSQGGYEDLRQCPYRFFAMRQLGLQLVDELDTELDKRDFGVWLHAVLMRFHESLVAQDGAYEDRSQWEQLMDAASTQASAAMALPEGEFLPFAASWPAVRDGYLQWLSGHIGQGMRFVSAETEHTQRLGDVTLKGRIDRIDSDANGQPVVLDYKTESASKSSARVRHPLEDTQIAFYAALLPHDTLRAGYVNLSEGETKWVEQKQISQARDALVEGIAHDLQRIAAGAALPALGQGVACDYCQARGLCRKDFWTQP